jgi:16S rRNA processing protein RimM
LNRQYQSLYAIGKVTKAFGVKGEVVVRPMTASPARFRKLKDVFIGKDASGTHKLAVEYARVEPRGVRLKFTEVQGRTDAENIVGSLIFVDEWSRRRERTSFTISWD